MAAITFRTAVQAALFEHEIKGQISDIGGHWENAGPRDHWRPWCEAEVKVGPNVGRDFPVRRAKYALASRELLSAVEKRMLGIARLTIALGHDAAEAFEHLYGCEGWRGIPKLTDEGSSRYWSVVRENLEKAFEQYDRSPDDIKAIVEDESSYGHKELVKDLHEMAQVMQTYPPAPVRAPVKKPAEIRFSQTACGEHFIRVGEKEVSFNVNDLSAEQVGDVINGLANIMGSLSAAMHRFQKVG